MGRQAIRIEDAADGDRGDSDATLMDAVCSGDMEALGALYMRYALLVQRAVLRTAPALQDADIEELVHDVFLALPDLAPRFDPRRSLRAWLYGIAVRMARNAARKAAWRRRLLARHGRADAAHQEAVGGAALHRDDLVRALERLPRDQATALVLHVVEGFSGEEIAQIEGVRLNTVWTRLHRARRTLLGWLEGDGSATSGGGGDGV